MECAAGHFGDLAAGLIVRPAKSCACRHQCMPGLLKARPARRGCLYQTAFCLAFVVWVLVCSSSLGRHSQTSPPPPPVSSRSVLVLLAEPEPQGEMPVPVPVPPGLKPCTWWVKTPNLGRERHYLPQGRFGFHWAFFPGFLRYSTISLVTPGCLRCVWQTLGFL